VQVPYKAASKKKGVVAGKAGRGKGIPREESQSLLRNLGGQEHLAAELKKFRGEKGGDPSSYILFPSLRTAVTF